MASRNRIGVVGAGYVGLCTAVSLAKLGHPVTITDLDRRRLDMVAQGRAPFYEPGLDEALAGVVDAGQLQTVPTIEGVLESSAIVFVAVGTPSLDDGSIDLSFVEGVIDAVAACVEKKNRTILVLKSTVIPGTAAEFSRRHADQEALTIVSNPEFLREGAALADSLHPDRIVIGGAPDDAKRVMDLYKGIDTQRIIVSTTTAEMIKYASNVMLAARLSVVNEMANLCRTLGIDWSEVATGVGADSRIGTQFMAAGLGFGGSCFPKDVAALRALGRSKGVGTRMMDATLQTNDAQPLEAVRILREQMDLSGARVAILGLAFKPGTDDVRESRALALHRALEAAGAIVSCHDPIANENYRRAFPNATFVESPSAAAEWADAIVLQTAWPEYRDAGKWLASRRSTGIVLDTRGFLGGAEVRSKGWRFISLTGAQ